jgi:hypothetical protein
MSTNIRGSGLYLRGSGLNLRGSGLNLRGSGFSRDSSLTRELAVGFVLSLVGAAFAASLPLALPAGGVYRAVVAALGLAYVLYRLSRATDRVGRVVTVLVWSAAAIATWLIAPSFAVYVAIHAGLIWLVRTFYVHSDLRAAAVDLGLSAMSLAFAVWAVRRTDSFLLGAWCFFLIQAMHVAIPAWLAKRGASHAGTDDLPEDRFAQAHRAAQEALKRLATAP